MIFKQKISEIPLKFTYFNFRHLIEVVQVIGGIRVE